VHKYLIAVGVFGIGVWLAQILPSVPSHVFGIGYPVTDPQWEFLLEVSTFTAAAAAVGFATARCKSVLRALCAVPVAALLIFLIPSRLGLWLSESFRSVAVNVTALGLLFVFVGAAAGWLVSRFLNRGTSHA
jgi:hypothetical protein